jgi:hypothetical protein
MIRVFHMELGAMGARRTVFLPRNTKIRSITGFLVENFLLPAAGSPALNQFHWFKYLPGFLTGQCRKFSRCHKLCKLRQIRPIQIAA